MLDLSNASSVTGELWDGVELTARIPEKMTDFFDRQGPTPVRIPDRRAYRRFYLRGKAVLRSDNRSFGIYTLDASRRGIGFFSPIQLLPKLRVRLQLPNVREFEIEIVRCCRLEECCYHCGAVFVGGI